MGRLETFAALVDAAMSRVLAGLRAAQILEPHRAIISLLFLCLFWMPIFGVSYSNYVFFGYYDKDAFGPVVDTIILSVFYTPFPVVCVAVVHALRLQPVRALLAYALLSSVAAFCVQATYWFGDTTPVMWKIGAVLLVASCGLPLAFVRFQRADVSG